MDKYLFCIFFIMSGFCFSSSFPFAFMVAVVILFCYISQFYTFIFTILGRTGETVLFSII